MDPTLSILGAFITAAGIFALLFWRVYQVQKHWTHVSFSAPKWRWQAQHSCYVEQGEPIEFDNRLQHYLKQAEVMITLSSASLVLIPKLHINTHPLSFAYSLVLLALCVLMSVLFMVFLSYFYEGSLYDPYSYTPKKSAMVSAFGFTALGCFALAYLVLACQVAVAVANGTIPVAK
jgi:hypothetical protein